MVNMTVTVGSLCTGIGGLDHGLTLAGLNTQTVFVSDIDPGACAWLEANSTAPNLGDFTALSELPPVDILTAGFPCQPLSSAGQRKGLEDDRWLFDDICRLVSRMETRPVVFLENVPGLLTANGGHAMAAVVYGLAAIGYRLDYGTLEAAAVGAPHRRRRWWGIAASADTVSERLERRPAVRQHPYERHPEPGGLATADADSLGSQSVGRLEHVRRDPDRCDGEGTRPRAAVFGGYWPAVARWEHVTGRPAPDPTTDGRLSPHFVEWMMGYPAGWVTDTLTSRRQALHALGNAVVPQCAAAAFTQLSARLEAPGGVVPAS